MGTLKKLAPTSEETTTPADQDVPVSSQLVLVKADNPTTDPLQQLHERSLQWAPSESDKIDPLRNLRFIEVCCDEFTHEEALVTCDAARLMFAVRSSNVQQWRIASVLFSAVLAVIAVIVGVRALSDQLGVLAAGVIALGAALAPVLVRELREVMLYEETKRLSAWDGAINKLLKRRRTLELEAKRLA
jgi:hypothetical protein